MIPVRGYEGHAVAVLGLGRSGLAAARALRAGGAEAVCWDDGGAAREAAAAEGFAVRDLARAGAFGDVAALIVSPGIPHLYPSPHPVVAAALAAGVPVDNDIGLFFRSFATDDWGRFDMLPRVVAVTGSNGKSTVSALIHHVLEAAGRESQLAGNIGRGRAGYRAAGGWRGRGAGAVVVPDRAGAGADAGCGGVHEPVAGPSRPAWRVWRVFRGEAAAVRGGRPGPCGDRRGRGGGAVFGGAAGGGAGRRPGDPGVGRREAGGRGVERVRAQGVPGGVAQGAAGGVV